MHLQKYLRLSYKNQVCNHISNRQIFSKTKIWDEKYTTNHRKDLEVHWKEQFNKNKPKQTDDKPKHYVLSMFPYPSGKLHMGHVRVYTISDVMAQYNRLLGYNVIHPMGWDSFGLPAENAAIEQNVEPATWTKSNIEIMKNQLSSLGCKFDWDREISTCDGSYYKWTQYLFIRMFKAGLVYQKMAPVNWDPVDKTVLADEQVDEKGRSWRSGSKVEKVLLKQWYIRTTAYSKSLYDGLSEVDKELWKDIINLQQNWIGKCDGARFQFKLKSDQTLSKADKELLPTLDIFTTTPESLHGVSHVVLSQKHNLNLPQFYDTADHKEMSEVQRLNISVINPFTNETVPIFVAKDDKFPFNEYLDHHVGIPSINEEDKLFASNHGLTIRNVFDKESGLIINSDEISGLSLEDAKTAILTKAKNLNVGGHVTSAKARDWLISRQRYWGTPIPIVHCPKYGAVPVSDEDLPVLLPEKRSTSPSSSSSSPPSSSPPSSSPPSSSSSSSSSTDHQNIKSPLANNSQWLKAKCANCDCDGHGTRETDTMDTFVDSSWYFLRYLDPNNSDAPFDTRKVERSMPVDLYIGGKEHATMHLYYARFLHHFLYDQKMTPSREPFKNLLTQGMVLGESFRLKKTGKYLKPENVEKNKDGKYVEKATGDAVIAEWEKMSKSKFNGVDPQDVLAEYGCDTTRICILSNASPKSDRPWSNDVFVGVQRWQGRLWNLVHRFISIRTKDAVADENVAQIKTESDEIDEMRNKLLLETKFHMDKTFLINTIISRMQMFSTELQKTSENTIRNSPAFERALSDLIIMLSPMAPMFTSELWAGIASVNHLNKHYDWESNVLDQKYPSPDEDYHLCMSVKVNTKLLTSIRLPMTYSEMESKLTLELARLLAEGSPKVHEFAATLPGGTLETHVKGRKMVKYGNSKVEYDIAVDEKMLKKLKASKAKASDRS